MAASDNQDNIINYAGDFRIKKPFEDYKYLDPARSVPYRHDSILLVLDSTEEGLNKWIH